MPIYTVIAFRWTGTYYNAQYNTAYSAVIDDDDAALDGGSDANELVSINGGPFSPTTGSVYNINVSFTDVSGVSHVESFAFFEISGIWYFVPGPGSAFTVGATLGNYQSHTTGAIPYDLITCFVRGTLIETANGPTPVENLSVGNLVLTAGGEYKPLRVSLSRRLPMRNLRDNPKLAPIRIMAGALGNGIPERDLLVSRQHRMLVRSAVCERMFGEPDALVSAIRLCELAGVFIDPIEADVEYFHLIFDQHEVIFAEGAPTESFYPGPQAIRSLSAPARKELLSIFPELENQNFMPRSARYIPTGKRQKTLVARHIRNNHAMLSDFPPSDRSLRAD